MNRQSRKNPAISVLLPVRDALPWLGASLASLWRQTDSDFEVVAVDDGSTDGSGEWLERAATREPRLVVLRTPARGLPAALNAGLARARGRLVARHDADDLSHRRRFELQRQSLAARRDVAVVGSRVRLFPDAEIGPGMRRWVRWHNGLLGHEQMAAEALIDSPLVHGTSMARRSWLERVSGWRDRGWPEDVDLWVRLLAAGARLAKRPEVLYAWRQHQRSATRRDPRYRQDRYDALRSEALRRGILRSHRRATLVGTGTSLARWRVLLGARVALAVEARRPSASMLAALEPPIVLVYGARPARERWRAALLDAGLCELTDFAFVG